jgi:hypothetical protein
LQNYKASTTMMAQMKAMCVRYRPTCVYHVLQPPRFTDEFTTIQEATSGFSLEQHGRAGNYVVWLRHADKGKQASDLAPFGVVLRGYQPLVQPAHLIDN